MVENRCSSQPGCVVYQTRYHCTLIKSGSSGLQVTCAVRQEEHTHVGALCVMQVPPGPVQGRRCTHIGALCGVHVIPGAELTAPCTSMDHCVSRRMQFLALCRDDLAVGQMVQVMPCNSRHAFHAQCLKPWLNQHNSCPVCRFELPTDDMAYEKRKERAAQEAEDRKGAANALSHDEFMYI